MISVTSVRSCPSSTCKGFQISERQNRWDMMVWCDDILTSSLCDSKRKVVSKQKSSEICWIMDFNTLYQEPRRGWHVTCMYACSYDMYGHMVIPVVVVRRIQCKSKKNMDWSLT